jgi:predicted lipoprotein with Yx(FWY)xxD motif
MRRLWAAVFLAVFATACGSVSTSGSGSSSSSSSAAAATTVQAIQKPSLSGVAMSNPAGLTLYRLTNDSAGTPTCTGACASTWFAQPAGSTLPTAPSGFSGVFGSVTGVNGTKQLTYNGWPVYYYSGDSSSTDANGQGSGGVWFAVTPATPVTAGATAANAATPAAATAAAAPATSNSGGGGGYYN